LFVDKDHLVVSNKLSRPEWLKVKAPVGDAYENLNRLIKSKSLHTVCESAHCPNMGECWSHGTATFMILGNICTRSCGFCAVQTGRAYSIDLEEPKRVADAVKNMALKFAVITSVNRDELEDGGASIFAETINQIRESSPECGVEVLIPDFRFKTDALRKVFEAKPNVLNHNTETVPSLYSKVRPQAKYEWSLGVIREAKKFGLTTKSGLMLGLGESVDEVLKVMEDLVTNGCDILTLGQYLQPTEKHLPVDRFWSPDEFKSLKDEGMKMGFKDIAAGPLVRSSYFADQLAKGLGEKSLN
jgi:lipoic acid synthetase